MYLSVGELAERVKVEVFPHMHLVLKTTPKETLHKHSTYLLPCSLKRTAHKLFQTWFAPVDLRTTFNNALQCILLTSRLCIDYNH